jgi:hypothetical protein
VANPASIANLKPWQKGTSGNPGGSAVGYRKRLTGAFLKLLTQDFDKHGLSAIEACRRRSPGQYLWIVASILPKQLEALYEHVVDTGSGADLEQRLAERAEAALERASARAAESPPLLIAPELAPEPEQVSVSGSENPPKRTREPVLIEHDRLAGYRASRNTPIEPDYL